MSDAIQLGPFVLDELIGKGGMGEVWRGMHADQGLPVAVKVITAEAARQSRYLEAFRNEVTAVARLDHPGIVWVLDYGTVSGEAEEASDGMLVAGSPYLTMELASGGTLHSVLRDLDWPAIKRVLLELLDALAHAHARGVIHRDLKPGNVLLAAMGDERPGLKLTDFGIARAMDFQPEETGGKPLGTLHYMAPEQVKAEWRQQGPWTDLYAVGCVAYRLVSGRLPFKGMRTAALMHAQIHKMPPPIVPHTPIPDGVTEWIETLLQKRPERRFRRAADAAYALLSIPDPITTTASPTTLEARFSGRTRLPVETTSLYTAFRPTALGDAQATPEPEGGADAAPPSTLARTRQPQPRSWKRPVPGRPSPRLTGAGLGLWGIRTVPLVGREAERDVLWRALREARRQRAPRLVVVGGPTGTGKTRLVEWIGQRADEVGAAMVLSASCTNNSPSGQALQQMFADLLKTAHLDAEDRVEHVAEQLEGMGFDDSQLAQAVAALCAPGTSDGLDDAGRFEVAWTLMERLADERPLYVWIDNAHYDAEALAFARWVASRADDTPLPLVLTLIVRDEDLAEAPEAASQVTALTDQRETVGVQLENLKRSHRSTLVRELLGLQPVLAAQVEQRTGGNPLFAIQLVTAWVSAQMLVVEDDGFALRDPSLATLPRSLDDVWQQRMRRVTAGVEDGERMLELAAVLGERVDLIEWSRVCDDPDARAAERGQMYFRPEGARARHALVQRMLDAQLAAETDAGWRFVHGMFREAVLDGARQHGRLQPHHHTVARMLAHVAGDAAEARRANHLLHSGDAYDAIPMLMTAAERRTHSSLPAALELIGRCEAALQATALPASDATWGRVALARAELLHLLGRDRQARADTAQVAQAARAHGWRDLHRRARLLGLEIDDACEAAGALDDARPFALSLPDNTDLDLFCRAWAVTSRLALAEGEHATALAAASRVVRRTQGHAELDQARGWALMAAVCAREGQNDKALALFAHCVRVYRTSRVHSLSLARALLAMGDAYLDRGAFGRAQATLREASRTFQRIGSVEIVHCLVSLAQVALTRESWRDAMVLWAHAERHASGLQMPSVQLRIQCGLASATAGLKDWTNAARHLAEAERLAEEGRSTRAASCLPLLLDVASTLQRRRQRLLAERALRAARRVADSTGDADQIARIDRRLESLD